MENIISASCKNCGSTDLRLRRYVWRKIKDVNGMSRSVKVPQLICNNCNTTMRHLPTNLMPYKQYERDIIEGVINGSITSSLVYGGEYPSEETMKLWVRQSKKGLL